MEFLSNQSLRLGQKIRETYFPRLSWSYKLVSWRYKPSYVFREDNSRGWKDLLVFGFTKRLPGALSGHLAYGTGNYIRGSVCAIASHTAGLVLVLVLVHDPNLTLHPRERGKMVCVMVQHGLASIRCIPQAEFYPVPIWGCDWCQVDLFLMSLCAIVSWGF